MENKIKQILLEKYEELESERIRIGNILDSSSGESNELYEEHDIIESQQSTILQIESLFIQKGVLSNEAIARS